MTPREVLALCREKDVKAVDLWFTDLLGRSQHLTIPVGKLDERVFEDGLGVGGSSIRGWRGVHESDILVLPQPQTAFLDPFAALPTLALICNMQDPLTSERFSRDPRHIATKAANYLKQTGIADVAHFAPEAEFFVFDSARYASSPHESFYHLVSADRLTDLRSEMMQAMLDCGLEVEAHHHQAASGGPCGIDLGHQPLVTMGDWMQIYKYCVCNVARRHSKAATFMPKPIFGDRGSGMHVHFSLWRDEEPLFAGGGYAGLSDMAQHAIGGILKHAPALLALMCPTTNSYKRLAAGRESPVNLVYSQRNRSAACRIPMYSQNPKAKRIEFRCPDPTCNPYLAFAAVAMAAIDGIQVKTSPGQPMDKDLSSLSPEELAEVRQTPATLDEALTALEKDCEFLLKGDVFTPEIIRAWIRHKREHEIAAIRLRPHPQEFCLYFDA
jgi:glutamine synthetase